METENITEVFAAIQKAIQTQVRVGMLPREQILAKALDAYSEIEFPEWLVPEAGRILDQAIAAQIALQASWPDETDCDRLDRAFAELEANGIVAIQNAVCCQSCAMEDVWFGIERMRAAGTPVRGYTFFHEQDTEAALLRDALYLAYGSTEKDPDLALQIGHAVQEQLEAWGFQVTWNGELRQRIKVQLLWQKRWT